MQINGELTSSFFKKTKELLLGSFEQGRGNVRHSGGLGTSSESVQGSLCEAAWLCCGIVLICSEGI